MQRLVATSARSPLLLELGCCPDTRSVSSGPSPPQPARQGPVAAESARPGVKPSLRRVQASGAEETPGSDQGGARRP